MYVSHESLARTLCHESGQRLIMSLLADTPEDVHQMPTAIQVFTSRMRDEACLQVGQIIDEVLNGSMAEVEAKINGHV